MRRVSIALVLACAMAVGACSPVAAAASRVGPHRCWVPFPVFRPAFTSSIRNGQTAVPPDRPLVLEATLPSGVATATVLLVKNGTIALEDRCDSGSRVVTGSAEASHSAAGGRRPVASKRVRISFLPPGGWKPGALHAVTLRAGRIALWKASFTTAPEQSPPGGGQEPDPDPEPEPPAPPEPDVYTLTGRFGWGSLDPNKIAFSVSKRTTITVSYNSLETVNTQYHQERLYFILRPEGDKGREYPGGGERRIEVEAGDYTVEAGSSLGTSLATMTVTVPRD